jgi:D-arabinose 1-dehydrogenase-like Zn-dependent alcohol dehydrogenase
LACGVCHGDTVVKYNGLGTGFPRVPGHEIFGTVHKLGPGVTTLNEGDTVGSGWFGGANCGGDCKSCITANRVCCQKGLVNGAHSDGGYAEYTIVRLDAIARFPHGTSPEKTAPLMCAGMTMFNSIRNSKARPGDVVVISGVGGLGHLGIQYANKMGYTVVVTSRDSSKKILALKLGAHHFIDTSVDDVTGCIMKLGGAKLVIYTATSSKGLAPLVNALTTEGELFLVAALTEAVTIDTLGLLFKRASIRGWASGDNKDIEDTVAFSKLSHIEPMIETFPWDQINTAFDRMMSAKAEFKVVMSGSWDKVNVQ